MIEAVEASANFGRKVNCVMFEPSSLFGNIYRYVITYTAYAGQFSEFEYQGEKCRLVSERELAGREIAEEVAHHIQEQDGIAVCQVIIHQVGLLAS
jgi:hypothetical protein